VAKRGKGKATVIGKLTVDDPVNKAKLLHLMRMFRDAVEMAHYHMRKKFEASESKRRLTKFLCNAWYASSAMKKAKLYVSQEKLKLTKPQLFSVGCSGNMEKGNRNIRLISTDKVLVKIPHADGKHEWLELKTKFGKKYLDLVSKLISEEYSYGASIVLKEENGKINFFLHISIPIDLYVQFFKKSSRNKIVGYIAGFDFNSDRINMVIINKNGILLDVKSEHFPEVTSHGFPREKAKGLRRQALAKLVKYARNHGVKYYVVENLERSKKKTICRKANRKISKWAVREYLTQMEILVKKVDGILVKINPMYSSVAARFLAKDLGLDVHTTSCLLYTSPSPRD